MIKIPEKISSKASLYAAIAIVAAIVLSVVATTITSINGLIPAIQYGSAEVIGGAIGAIIGTIVGSIIGQILPLSIAVILFIKKAPRWLISIPLAITFAGAIIAVIGALVSVITLFVNRFHWVSLVSAISLLLTTPLLVIASLYATAHSAMTWLKKFKLGFIPKLWFIPGALTLVCTLITLLASVITLFGSHNPIMFIISTISLLLTLAAGIVDSIADLLIGIHFNNLIDGDNKAIVE